MGRTQVSEAYDKGRGNPSRKDYTMLWNGAIEFDWGELEQYPDDCMLVALPTNFIALLESVLRFADGSPHLWRDIEGRNDPRWQEVRQFIQNGRSCLLMGCKVADLNKTLQELVTIAKYLTAAFTDGVVRDHYYDPGHPETFAEKVGVEVEDLPEWDLNPLDGDILHPNMSTFDSIGTNTVIDPDTGETITTTSRRMVEEVPSVWIYDGWQSDMSFVQLYVDTMYQSVWPAADVTFPTGTIPFANALMENMERQDLALRHINAKLSRSGRVELDLMDEPQIRHPLTGKRTPLSLLLGQYGLPFTQPGTNDPWPLQAYTHPSVFTAGDPQAQDPLGNLEKALFYDSWLGDATARGLLAGFRPTIRLTEGLAPVLTFPAINVPLPGNLGTINIPPMPLYAGTYDLYIPGDSGRGLADQLKLEEDINEKAIDVPGLGVIKIKWDMNRLMVKIPSLPTLPGGGALPHWLSHYISHHYLYGLTPGEWSQIFPYIRTQWHQRVYDETKQQKSGLAQTFKDILQIQVPNPLYKPYDPADPDTLPASLLPQMIDGKTFAELFWIHGQKESGEFGKELPGLAFAELFAMKPDDPNYRPNMQTHAQILNFMQLQLAQGLADLISAIDECCANGAEPAEIKGVLEAIADNMGCLVLTHQALVNVTGGKSPDCAPTTTPPDPGDCAYIQAVVEELINVLDWLVWGVENIGGMLASPIINALVKFRWFVAILVAVGLVEPSPAEEVVTVPLGVVALLTYVVEKGIEAGALMARQMVNEMKAQKASIVALLCGTTEATIDPKLDEVIDSISDTFTDIAIKETIKELLEGFLKSPEVKQLL